MAKPAPVTIPTEPIGSIPRPVDLIERIAKADSEDPSLDPRYEDAIRETIDGSSATIVAGGPPIILYDYRDLFPCRAGDFEIEEPNLYRRFDSASRLQIFHESSFAHRRIAELTPRQLKS